VQVHTSSCQKNTIVPMSTFGRGKITRSTPPEPPFPGPIMVQLVRELLLESLVRGSDP
jgi:hypothetical protein